MTDDAEDLIETLEEIREEDYPDIPKSLLREIVEIEYDSVEKRSEAQNRVDEIVDSHIEEEQP